MSRQLSIVCTMIVFAFVSAASGCSNASSPTPVAHPGVAGIQVSPQSLGSWTTKAPMPTARYGFASGKANGILYAVGGYGSEYVPINTVEAYDPATDSWIAKASMPTARAFLAVGVVNGILYAIGGYNSGPLNTVEAYDPVTDTWTTRAPMPTARYAFGVGVVDGILYAVGGSKSFSALNTAEAYNPATDT